MTEDEKEFEEWVKKTWPSKTMGENWLTSCELTCMRMSWFEGRRTLREKIKSDPSIGKLEVEDWPENPDY
jgi:hypothetical protein